MAERGGRRSRGVTRPDPGQGPWADLVALLYDRLYVPAGRPSQDEIERRGDLKSTKISRSTAYAILTLRRNPEWATFKALVVALDGHPDEWKPRWEEAKNRFDHERRTGKRLPLPGIENGDEYLPRIEERAVGDWQGRPSSFHQAWWRLRQAPRGIIAAVRFHWRDDPKARQRQIILEIFRDYAGDLLRPYREATHIEPRLVRVQQPSTARRGRREQWHTSAEPGTPPSGERYPNGTTVLQLLDESAQTLTLISDAGMGKTTQLALLTEELIQRALEAPPGAKVVLPVLVDLSTFRGQPFREWLISEISKTHQIAPKLVRGFLAVFEPGKPDGPSGDDVLLLLDGLDKIVEDHHRLQCVEHLKELRRRCHGLVVSSRVRDYHLVQRIQGVRCVLIDIPDREAVQWYLTTNDEALADVRAALEDDPSLWELLQSPLMLDIIHRTYSGRKANELRQSGSPDERRNWIFDAYLRRMLDEPSRYSQKDTIKWLTWLARTLTERGEDVFYLERLQSAVLADRERQTTDDAPAPIMATLASTFALAWIAVAGGPVAIDWGMILTVSATSWTVVKWKVKKRGERGRLPVGIEPVTGIQWRLSRRRIVLATLAAPTAFTFGAAAMQPRHGWWLALSVGCSLALSALIALLGGNPGKGREPIRPNQAIAQSGISAGIKLLFFLSGLLLMAPALADMIRRFSPGGQYLAGLLMTLFSGTFLVTFTVLLEYGADAFIRHWVLRCYLARTGYAPLRYVRFLHECEQRILLRRVGSGFAFQHQTLQEHCITTALQHEAGLD
jgi:hypothetical protein